MTHISPPKDKLVLFMQELGPACTADEDTFRNVVRQCTYVNEQTAAEVLGLLARSSSSSPEQTLSGSTLKWNLAVVVDVLKQAKDLDWLVVAELLDFDDFIVPDAQGFSILSSAYKLGAGQQLPVKAIVGRQWRNMQGQLSLLLQSTGARPEVYSFEGAERKLPAVQGLVAGRSAVGSPNHAWLCTELLEVLSLLTEAGQFPTVRRILELPAKGCPEVRTHGRSVRGGQLYL